MSTEYLSNDHEYHIRYLNARIKKLSTNPEINQNQIPVLIGILEIAKQAQSYEDYIEKLGEDFDFFPVAKSEQVDRFASLEKFYSTIELKEHIELAANKKKIAEDCRNYSDLALRLPQGHGSGFQLEKACHERLNAVSSFLTYLVHYSCLGDPKEKVYLMKTIQSEWQKIRSSDPDFSFASLLNKPYSYINPFDKEKLSNLERIFQENQ